MSNKSVKCQTIRKTIKRFSSLLMKKGVRFSLISALFLTIACYFANNFPLFTGESLLQLHLTQKISELLHIHSKVNYGSVLFCNTSFDIDLVPVLECYEADYSDTLGYNVITDREKLLKFLELLEESDKYNKSNGYKYLILDLAFDERDKTEYDDALYEKILNMRDVVVGNDDSFELASKLKNKNIDGLVEYFITKTNTSFTRYEYIEDDKRSLPLFVFEKLYPDSAIKRYGIGRFSLYFSDGRLCQNSDYLTFDERYPRENKYLEFDIDSINDDLDRSVTLYRTVNSFISNEGTYEEKVKELAAQSAGKIVIIGDFYDDNHDTYMGEKPGPVLLARALQSLVDGKNIVSLWHTVIWYIIFSLMSMLIYLDKPISLYVPIIKKIPYKFVHLLISLISYGAILTLISLIECSLYDRVSSLIIPMIFFGLLKLFVQYRKFDSI